MSVKAWHKNEAGLAGVKGSSLYALLCGWDQGPRSLSKTQSQQQSWAKAQISGGHSWALTVGDPALSSPGTSCISRETWIL